MAKLSSASIRLVQKMNRRNRDGEYPIYIVVCFSGRVEKATGVSCLQRHWDAKREIIKSSCSNAPVLNKMLSDIKQKVIERKNEYEYNGKRYTPHMLLQDTVIDLSAKDGDYLNLCETIIRERRLRYGTIKRYKYSYRKLCEFLGRDNFIVDELTVGVVKDFALWLEKTGIKTNTIKCLMGCLSSVWNYAIQRKIVDATGYPFSEFKYCQKYKECPRDYFLEESHIVRLRDYFLDMVIERNGDLWKYSDGAFDRLHLRYSKEFSLLWFLMCYKCNGSAPVDIALMRTIDCKRVTINKEDYWAIDIRRKKTGRDVHIRLKRDIFIIIALEHFIGFSTTGYVYPIITASDGLSDSQILEQSHRCSVRAIKHIKEAFRAINEDIARSNAEGNPFEPLVELDRLVFYTVRHSRASHYFNTPGATIGGLASMLARSANTIATYAHTLTKDEEIAQIDDVCVI